MRATSRASERNQLHRVVAPCLGDAPGEDLDRGGAEQRLVLREVDDAHPPAADEPLEAVVPELEAREARQVLGEGGAGLGMGEVRMPGGGYRGTPGATASRASSSICLKTLRRTSCASSSIGAGPLAGSSSPSRLKANSPSFHCTSSRKVASIPPERLLDGGGVDVPLADEPRAENVVRPGLPAGKPSPPSAPRSRSSGRGAGSPRRRACPATSRR